MRSGKRKRTDPDRRIRRGGFRLAGLRLICGLIALLLWWEGGRNARATGFIDYLYIEANEGDSSGGHAALRFGDETFHFQHETPGALRIRRIDSGAFDNLYAMLGNRAIHESRIAVPDDTRSLLRDAFSRYYLAQEAQFEYREALGRDIQLFERLRDNSIDRSGRLEGLTMVLKGPGYFLSDGPETGADFNQSGLETEGDTPRSPALVSLLHRIQATHGEDFISERIVRARTAISDLRVRAVEPAAVLISPGSYPAFPATASTRYEEALLALYALKIVQAAPPLKPGTFRTSRSAAFRLSPEDLQFLKAYADRLEGDLAALATSSRSDWGLPLIIGMARLAAIEASLSSGQLVILDIFPGTDRSPQSVDASLRRYLPAMTQEKETLFLRKRDDFFSGGRMREADYAAIERVGNQLLELEQARGSGRSPRNDAGIQFPSREARLTVPLPARMDSADVTRELTAAQETGREYTESLDRLYPYDLVRRNCVTEIFAVINGALAQRVLAAGRRGEGSVMDDTAAVRDESERALGGYIDAAQDLSFIPFLSAGKVDATYSVVSNREQPSYRTLRISEMSREESPLIVAIRESNTITSTVYRPGPGDSAFLFFTDDTVLLRPLLGAFNLLTGIGESLAGIATMPFEGTERFLSGTRGVLFSLPELAFVNLRKGSMAYVEQSALK